ncbi:hypothetical protein ACELLULO517_06080 [Acidisoma cellulosilytica]|uniref:Uncharacterized protein n=1 Tax=Acidisoma cellulosilyticum TaxID=2802395 RepID=A0A964E2N1_9PROT|nr:hypothetical protein [Acidisoma cellulosilyticum]MCB8879795.1 hypothetical protein [Acidisoma cellulosilyticum]
MPASSPPNPPTPPDSDRSSSVQWLMTTTAADLQDPPASVAPTAPVMPKRRPGRTIYRAGIAALVVVAIGEVVLWAKPGLRADLFGSASKTGGQSHPGAAEPAIVKPKPVLAEPATPAPKILLVGPKAPPKTEVAPPKPVPPPVIVTPPPPPPPPAKPIVQPQAEATPKPDTMPKPDATTKPDTSAKPVAKTSALPPLPVAAPPPAQVPFFDTTTTTTTTTVKPPPAAPSEPAQPQAELAAPKTSAAPKPEAPASATTVAPAPAPLAEAKPVSVVVALVKPAPPPPAAPAAQPAPLKTVAAAAPQVVPASAAVDLHFNVRLSFTADEQQKATAFVDRLRREGFTVTTVVIAPNPNRWPGVAFFFDSDVDKAALIARQLSEATGRTEHARLSDRHPYPQAGTVEVSLLDHAKPKPEKAEKRSHSHHSS